MEFKWIDADLIDKKVTGKTSRFFVDNDEICEVFKFDSGECFTFARSMKRIFEVDFDSDCTLDMAKAIIEEKFHQLSIAYNAWWYKHGRKFVE